MRPSGEPFRLGIPWKDDRHPVVDEVHQVVRLCRQDGHTRGRLVIALPDILETYDASYYETQLIRAAKNVLSPRGWDRTDIPGELSALEDTTLSSFGSTSELS